MNSNTVAALVSNTATGRDAYGNDVLTPSVAAWPGVFWPDFTGETTDGQEQVTWQATVCLPAAAEVSAVDAVVPQALVDGQGQLVLDEQGQPRGDRYEVDGAPTIWPSTPWGYRPDFPVELKLKRTTG